MATVTCSTHLRNIETRDCKLRTRGLENSNASLVTSHERENPMTKLRTRGSTLVDGDGNPVRLRGVALADSFALANCDQRTTLHEQLQNG
jgi:hypothetical protein